MSNMQGEGIATSVLVASDDLAGATSLGSLLRRQSDWTVEIAVGFADAFRLVEAIDFDVLYLSFNRSSASSEDFSLCRAARNARPKLGVVFLSSHSDLQHKLRAFDAGADDYLASACEPIELLARARALLRRHAKSECSTLCIGANTVVHSHTRVLAGPAGTSTLTRTEFRFLAELAACGTIGTPTESLAGSVLGRKDEPALNLVHRHLSNIRAKLRAVGATDAVCRRASGYLLRSA